QVARTRHPPPSPAPILAFYQRFPAPDPSKDRLVVQEGRILVVRFPSSRSLGLAMVVGLALLIVVLYALVAPASVLLLGLPLWLGYSALRSAFESEDR
ncbi:MAG: hypothetical protein ACRD0K_19620, partial [Egibacteraceae bacterium]